MFIKNEFVFIEKISSSHSWAVRLIERPSGSFQQLINRTSYVLCREMKIEANLSKIGLNIRRPANKQLNSKLSQ